MKRRARRKERALKKQARMIEEEELRKAREAEDNAEDTNSMDIIEKVAPFEWIQGSLLSRGAYGSVYEGLTDSGNIIAAKKLDVLKHDYDEKYRAQITMFRKEIEIMRNLDSHPNIVKYLGYSFEPKHIYIFMEYIPGGSLASLMSKYGPLSEHVVCVYSKQILEGLEFLHLNKIVHRDIKGGNILVDTSGTIKLADFGCSKTMQGIMSDNFDSFQGTPYWMAPEVITQDGHGRPADIWSFGGTVIEMVTAKPPYYEKGQMATVFFSIINQEMPTIPKFLSEKCVDMIHQCYCWDPVERPNATDLLRHPFLHNRSLRDSSKSKKEQRTITDLSRSMSAATVWDKENSDFSKLPFEVGLALSLFLDSWDICTVSAVCTHWNIIFQRSDVWKEQCLKTWNKLYYHPNFQDASMGNNFKDCFIDRYESDSTWRNMSSLNISMQLKGHSRSVHSVAIMENSNRIISGSDDKKVKIWTWSDKKVKQTTLRGHTASVYCVISNPSESIIVSGSYDNEIKIWDIKSKKCLQTFDDHEWVVKALLINDDILYSASWDSTIGIWDLERSENIQFLKGHDEGVHDISILDNILVSSSIDRTVKLWDIRTGECVRTWDDHTNEVTSVDISDGFVLSGSGDGTVREWSLESNRQLSVLPHTRDNYWIWDMKFDGYNNIITAGENGMFVMWDYNNDFMYWDREQHSEEGNSNTIFSIAPKWEEGICVTAGRGKNINIWMCS
eukprot:TRINITY_DN6222_c0_g1_i1.p1 TRINITY_DN6222_c0_g1~~TRINITY_DN6222_c0_g1_i1.p1  ORF type:complete len:728 (-),score=178.16 TRINITY_DN6222_c0_g1_i1:73-2256(-)